MRYNKNLIPQPHYHKFRLNDVRHLMMLREGHPNKYPKLEDFRTYKKGQIQSGKLNIQNRIHINNLVSGFIHANHSLFDQIFQSSQFLKGLSVSLFSVYKKKDSHIKASKSDTNKNIHNDWNEGEKGRIPSNLIYVPDNQSTGIRCKDLSKIKVEHHYKPTKDDIPESTLIIGLYFAHKPTYCNFWHCEITMYVETPSGERYIGYEDIRKYLIDNYQEKDSKVEKIVKVMAKLIRSELYRYLVLNPKGRKKYLSKHRYMM